MARRLTRKLQVGRGKGEETTEVVLRRKGRKEEKQHSSDFACASLQTAYVPSSRKSFSSISFIYDVSPRGESYQRRIRVACLFESEFSALKRYRRSSATSLNVLYAVKGSKSQFAFQHFACDEALQRTLAKTKCVAIRFGCAKPLLMPPPPRSRKSECLSVNYSRYDC